MRLLLTIGLLVAFNPAARAETPDEAAELKAIAVLLAGSYSSAEQAKADAAFFDVRLHMVPIWTERAGEHWLYVEQAMATALDKPYRQRVYKLVRQDGKPVSLVYLLPGEALKYAGAWKQEKPLADVKPEQLVTRDGCGIVLAKKAEGHYTGATVGKECKSDLKGASYATSEVALTADLLTSWDRGYDAADKQVWGAVSGPYKFAKEKPKK